METSLPKGIDNVKVRKTIETIAFDRAKKFLPGIAEDEIDSKILQFLISKGVLVSSNHYVRLKYDIFEDICFEVKFDSLFEASRGNYTEFFSSIEKYGRCVHRRYQIWVENKLFGKKDRDRFISKLLFEPYDSLEWQEQTIIGIVKSNFCGDFFDEYDLQLLETGLYRKTLALYSEDKDAFTSVIHEKIKREREKSKEDRSLI